MTIFCSSVTHYQHKNMHDCMQAHILQHFITMSAEPKVVKPIQAEAVSGDPQSLCLWCQFSAVFCHHTVTWSRDGSALAEIKRRY